jgi:hypothetical protein
VIRSTLVVLTLSCLGTLFQACRDTNDSHAPSDRGGGQRSDDRGGEGGLPTLGGSDIGGQQSGGAPATDAPAGNGTGAATSGGSAGGSESSSGETQTGLGGAGQSGSGGADSDNPEDTLLSEFANQVERAESSAARALSAQGMTAEDLRIAMAGDPDRYKDILERTTAGLGTAPIGPGISEDRYLPPYDEPHLDDYFYCGPGALGLIVGGPALAVAAGECINRVCYAHDICYADFECKLEHDIGFRCLWSDSTARCDDNFFSSAYGCWRSGECGPTCLAVVGIASTARSANPFDDTCRKDIGVWDASGQPADKIVLDCGNGTQCAPPESECCPNATGPSVGNPGASNAYCRASSCSAGSSQALLSCGERCAATRVQGCAGCCEQAGVDASLCWCDIEVDECVLGCPPGTG